MINREAVYAALWARLSTAAGFKTKSRRLRHWSDCSPSERPALYMACQGQSAEHSTGKPTIHRLAASLYIYVHTPDPAIPSQALNAALDAVSATLPLEINTGRCTLGGLVHDCRISGQIETDEGTLGDDAVAIVPVEVIVYD